MGNAGPVIILVCSLAVIAIVGFFLLTYFAHCFLTVVIDSAAGIDEVRWPSESITEWITHPFYVGWVLLPILFVPSILYAVTGDGYVFGIVLLALLWLVSPIMYLSSLAAKSWLALLYGPFLKRWARYIHAYCAFLLWSGPLTLLGVAMLTYAMTSMTGVLLATFFLPPVFMLYFRVFGRYAWYVTTRRMRQAKKKKSAAAKSLKRIADQADVLDPWAIPTGERTESMAPAQAADEGEISTSITELTDVRAKVVAGAEPTEEEPEHEWTKKKKPYGIMTEAQSRQSYVTPKRESGADNEGYAVDELSLGAPVSLWQYYMEREKKEEELREQGKSVRQYERPRKPPTLWQAMTREIAGFLFYGHTLRACMNLSILLAIVLVFLNVIVGITRSI